MITNIDILADCTLKTEQLLDKACEEFLSLHPEGTIHYQWDSSVILTKDGKQGVQLRVEEATE